MKMRLASSYRFGSTTINYECECEIADDHSHAVFVPLPVDKESLAESLSKESTIVLPASKGMEVFYPLVSQVMHEFFSRGEENCIEVLKERIDR